VQTLAGLAIATLVVASIVVGIRLLALHRRSGEAPELLLGLLLLLAVGIGYPLKIVSEQVDVATARPLLAVSALSVALGFTCLLAFTWGVFRPHSGWARAVTAMGSLSLLGTGLWDALESTFGAVPNLASDVTPQSLIHAVTVIAAYLWTAWEALRYRGMLSRRVQLGMADPVVSNRLLLWGLMSLIVSAGILLNVVAGIRGVNIVESPAILLGSSATGISQTVLLVLVFAPPRAYRDWVRGHAPAPTL
jgi:hypothetical protein